MSPIPIRCSIPVLCLSPILSALVTPGLVDVSGWSLTSAGGPSSRLLADLRAVSKMSQ